MAHQFSFTISHDQHMRCSSSQLQVVPASSVGVMLQQANDLTNKSDREAVYELVTLGTRYSSSVVGFSNRLQSKNRQIEELNEKVSVLQRLVQESDKKITDLK